MQVATGTVVNGKIVLEGVPLAEGAKVTIVTRGADEGFSLTEAQEDALLESLAEIERGEFVTLEGLLASLPKASLPKPG
jgi:predicted transcriptional regulator